MGTRFKTLFQKIIIGFIPFIFLLISCSAFPCINESEFKLIKNRYAEGFKIYQKNSTFLIHTKRQKIITGKMIPPKCLGYVVIQSPVKKIITTSTTHNALLEMLKVSEALVGFSDLKLITTDLLMKRAEENKILHLGYPLDREKVLMLNPEMIMGYSAGALDEDVVSGLEKMNQKVVLNDDFLEESLLARAEWIKFVAVFFDKWDSAEKIFKDIDTRYDNLKKMVKDKKQPLVMMGENTNGIWIAPGGKSDIVRLVSDAGGDYVWSSKKTKQTLHMNLESVWNDINKAEIWLTQNTWFKISDLVNADKKYLGLDVVKKGQVYNHIKRLNKWKNMNYWETGVMRPDLLLKDLIIIFHPDVIRNETLNWYDVIK